MIKSRLSKSAAVLSVLVVSLAVTLAPSCTSSEEESESPQDEIRDEADFDPSDGAN